MKSKLLLILLAILLAQVLVGFAAAGPVVPAKIDSADHTLSTPNAAQFYSANPPAFSDLTGTAADAQLPAEVPLTDEANVFTANLSLAGADVFFAFDANSVWRIGSVESGNTLNNALLRFDASGHPVEQSLSADAVSLLGSADAAAMHTLIVTDGSIGAAEVDEGDDYTWSGAHDFTGANVTGLDAAGFAVFTPAAPTGTSLTVDLAARSYVVVDTSQATGDVLLTFTNPQPGKPYFVEARQGATARRLVLPGGEEIPAGDARAIDLAQIVSNGPVWQVQSLATDVPDPATAAYADELRASPAAKVLTGASLAKVNALVRYLKTEGLWDDTCALLLSSDFNAGSGATAYTLGGWTGNDAALVHAPAWNATGLEFDGSNDYATLDLTGLRGAGSFTVMARLIPDATAAAETTHGTVVFFGTNASSRSWYFGGPTSLLSNETWSFGFQNNSDTFRLGATTAELSWSAAEDFVETLQSDGDGTALWKDGTAVTFDLDNNGADGLDETTDAAPDGTGYSADDSLTIGAVRTGASSYVGQFDGEIRVLFFFRTTLPPPQREALLDFANTF